MSGVDVVARGLADQVGAQAVIAAQRHNHYLGLFGDSHTNAAFYTTGAPADGVTPPDWFVEGAVNNHSRAWGWAHWVGPLSLQRAQVVRSWARQTNGLLVPGSDPVGQSLSVQVSRALASPEWPLIAP